MTNKAQISVEYLVIIGFVSFVIIATLGIAFFYSGSINDQIRFTQINNLANKIISSSESVFYAGEPSKATITVYFPEKIIEFDIIEDSLVITVQTSSGLDKIAFKSKVPIEGSLDSISGLKKIQMIADENKVIISKV